MISNARGFRVLVADTTAEVWRWKNVKRKTDRDDVVSAVMNSLRQFETPFKAGQPPPSLCCRAENLASTNVFPDSRTSKLLPTSRGGWTKLGQVCRSTFFLQTWPRSYPKTGHLWCSYNVAC